MSSARKTNPGKKHGGKRGTTFGSPEWIVLDLRRRFQPREGAQPETINLLTDYVALRKLGDKLFPPPPLSPDLKWHDPDWEAFHEDVENSEEKK